MAATGKQIEGVTGESSVCELARAAICQRLATVSENFPLAAAGNLEDREPIHQLRVSTRRAVAALELFADYCPPRRTRKLQKLLKRIRRTAGAARDLDVFTHRLSKTATEVHQLLVPHFETKREAAQQEIASLYEKLYKDDQLTRRIEAVNARIKPRGKRARRQCDKQIDAWAPKQLHKAICRLLGDVPDSFDEPAELHPLRIDGKRLRYSLELLASCVREDTYKALYSLLEELQDRLGAINDHLIAMERLEQHADENRAAFDCAIKNERTGMEKSVTEFRPWFYKKFLPKFKAVIQHEQRTPDLCEPPIASS